MDLVSEQDEDEDVEENTDKDSIMSTALTRRYRNIQKNSTGRPA